MKKSIITGVVLSVLVFVFIGCSTVPVTTFNGEPRDPKDVATLTYTPKWGIDLTVYKVDGKLSRNYKTTGLNYSYHPTASGNPLNPSKGKINLQLLPGKHELEVILYEPEKIKMVTYDFKAGGSYEFLYEDDKLVLMENIGDKKVAANFEINDVSAYKGPGENEPHAILIKNWGNNSNVYVKIYGIDGLAGEHYSGRFFNESVYFVNYPIRIKPGMHTIDYKGSVGNKNMLYISSKKFNFEAGKKYKINFLDITKKVKELEEYDGDLGMAHTELVEVKE